MKSKIFLFVAVLTIVIFFACKKSTVTELTKEQLTAEVAKSKDFDAFAISAKTMLSITSKDETIATSFSSIIEKSEDQRSVIEQQIFDSYTIQVKSLLNIKSNWPEITKFTYTDFSELISQYESFKASVNSGSKYKLDFLSDEGDPNSPDCNKVRNEEVNTCFSRFLYDIGSCLFFDPRGPKCFADGVVAQYRCNQDAEKKYKGCMGVPN